MTKIYASYQFLLKVIISVCFGSFIFFSNAIAAINTTDLLQQGQNFYQQGDFATAVEKWEDALSKVEYGSSTHFDMLIQLAAAKHALGSYADAVEDIQQALSIAERSGIPEQKVLAHSYLGDVLLAMQQPDIAKTKLEDQLDLARTLNDPQILANLLNNLGNALSVLQEYTEALQAYQEVADIAKRVGNTLLQVQALSNQAQIHLKLEEPETSVVMLEKALSLMPQLSQSFDKAFLLLGLGQLAVRIQKYAQFPLLQRKAYQVFTEVIQFAEQYQDKRLKSYAKGFLGQLYEHKQRYREALQLTREAIFSAQGMPDILYLWEWQRARLLQAQGNLENALDAYRRALDYLQPIRSGLTTGQRNAKEVFYERIRPVYYGLADVLLQQASATSSQSKKNELLIQARNAVELLKAAELQDYFQDECVSAIQVQITQLEHITQKNTAIFYPILLSDRMELLLTTANGIRQFVVPIGYDTLGQTVLTFRRNLQRTTDGSFIKQAKQLYQWLITPLENELSQHKVDTLVIVPDSFLRTVPLAALFNAKTKKFLFQQVALAATPGLTLTDPRSLSRKNIRILLNGLSEGVQGFSPLPSVTKEIQNINKLFSNSMVLLDQEFSLEHVNQALQSTPYEIVHVSSHGQFDRDPKKSFLLTYDNKLTMDRLETLFRLSEMRKDKVELLTLSACQTAVGDERAALGLAGVAIKAGARSALASLWFVDDDATSQLVAEFYSQLRNPALSKAQALQSAQKELTKQRKFRHPAYWAPFLLIGNWL
ncbi:CHAT domain-containing protein [Candidatus Parabeggiatoa sp. HSG14]|uniref:CHAT domain-containing protein n=1 Tax=Candidatus Parabeggiatoa sp. HSG14 TaxID=3055593 RepID=UPI0025A91278|nr:CHAT domain-containing protein [Thiotrichales bacterium HSG14]